MENVSFDVIAGKYEDGMYENIKYLNSFTSIDDAVNCVRENKLTSYHFCRIEQYSNGVKVKVYS